MPTVRAIVREAAKNDNRRCRPSSGHRQQPGVPDGGADARRPDERQRHGQGRRARRVSRRRDDHHEEAPFPPHDAAGHGRDAWRCRFSRRWCRREPRWRRPLPRTQDAASPPSRWCTARPAAPSSASKKYMWAPAAGRPRLRPVAEQPQPARAVPRLPDHRQQHRRAQRRGVQPPGDRRRPLPLERGVPHAVRIRKQTQGSDVYVGTSLDQMYAQRFGQDTPIPSMQLCIENVDQAGGCSYGYSCVYTDTISWASPTEPLPMIRDPRVVFDQLFGVGATPGERARTGAPRTRASSTGSATAVARLKQGPRRDRSRAPRPTTSTTSARSSAASSASRRATAAASRASCPRRRSACPTRSKSTSS